MPGYLDVADAKAVMQGDGLPEDMLASSEGATILDRSTNQVMRIGTITPRIDPLTGACVFYSNGLCEVHSIKPYGCACAKVCDERPQTEQEVMRTVAVLQDIMASTAYQEMREHLPKAEPLSDRKGRLHRLLEQGRRKRRRGRDI
jgi:Fe-S-cluster containining protein